MPYKDPDKRREYARQYQRTRMAPAGGFLTPAQTPVPPQFRLKTAQDVIDLLGEQVNAVRGDEGLSTAERARTIGYLAGIALRAIEAGDLAGRLEALERILAARRAAA